MESRIIKKVTTFLALLFVCANYTFALDFSKENGTSGECSNSESDYRQYANESFRGDNVAFLAFCNNGSYTVDTTWFYIQVNGETVDTYTRTGNLLGWDNNGWFTEISKSDVEYFFGKDWDDLDSNDKLTIDFKFKIQAGKTKKCSSVSFYPKRGEKRGIKVRAKKTVSNAKCKVGVAN